MPRQAGLHLGSNPIVASLFRKASRVVVIGVIVMGLGFSIGSIIVLWRTNTWVAASATTTGTVSGHSRRAASAAPPPAGGVRRTTVASGQRGTLAEIVEFTTPDGTRHEFRSSISSTDPFAVGTTVPVRYNQADPTDATIDTWFRVWGFPAIFLAAGLVEIAVGLGFAAVARRVSA